MAAQLRVLRRRIRTIQSTKRITKAMELIATSRIARAQARVESSRPYAREITKVLSALASAAGTLDHPLLAERENPTRAAMLVVTSDRGLCGGYNANLIRAAEELHALLREEGKSVALYLTGRKAVRYYTFRQRPIEQSWTGFSEQPSYADAATAGNVLVRAFLAGADAAGIVLGARVPIILTSRADALLTRLASCAVAVLVAASRRASLAAALR